MNLTLSSSGISEKEDETPMSIDSQKTFEVLSQPPAARFSSFSPPAPRGSVRRTEQTRKPVPPQTANVVVGIFR